MFELFMIGSPRVASLDTQSRVNTAHGSDRSLDIRSVYTKNVFFTVSVAGFNIYDSISVLGRCVIVTKRTAIS